MTFCGTLVGLREGPGLVLSLNRVAVGVDALEQHLPAPAGAGRDVDGRLDVDGQVPRSTRSPLARLGLGLGAASSSPPPSSTASGTPMTTSITTPARTARARSGMGAAV